MLNNLVERYRFLRFHTLHMRSRRAIESWQITRFNAMAAHARANVPLYTALYGDVPKGAMRVHNLQDLRRFPIINKLTFRGHAPEEYTDTSAKLVGKWATTSGTSGEPFTMLTSPHAEKRMPYRVSMAYRPIFWGPNSVTYTPMRVFRILTKTNPAPYRRFMTVTKFLEDPVAAAYEIINFRPAVIETFASVLETFADTVRDEKLPFTVRYAITCGERMTPALRTHISDVLHCEVFNRYGMEEFKVVAMECAKHNGMHTTCESLIVEVVDEHGDPVPDGTPGRILVTDLYNRSMPFIRYDTGDSGKMVRTTCACGGSAPRVWLEGRYAAFLTFSGKRVNHLEFDAALETFMDSVLRYVVVKESEHAVSVRIVPGPLFSATVEQQIQHNISQLAGEGVTVRVECVEEIPHTVRGKSRIVLDLSAPSTSASSGRDAEPLFT